MFSGPVRPESSALYSQYDRRMSYTTERPPAYEYVDRPRYEPPRPLEPRPSLLPSLSDSANTPRRQDSSRSHGGITDHRANGPSLPGLRDILTPGPTSTEPASYSSAWRTPSATAAPSQSHYASTYVHPPMMLEPHSQRQQEGRPRSWEVPARTSDASQPAQSVPISPFTGYPTDYGPSSDRRYEYTSSQSTGTHRTSNTGSSYGVMVTTYDPGQPSTPSAASAENQKKYLGIKDIPGEGTYHFYEGGYRIPTHVDGEHVNPAWGLTKANKPRKRLALACLDCREKKIKCEPGASSCLQCEKARRPCRRTQAQQLQPESTPGTEWSPGSTSHSRAKASISDPTPTLSSDVANDSAPKRRPREDPSPPGVPNKKHRSASPLPAMIRDAPLPPREAPSGDSASKPLISPRQESVISWENDPHAVEPDVTLELLDLYFAHVNSATYCLFPYGHFMHWLKSSRDKCQNERMVLYAMLAMASVFADDRLAGFGRQCARISLDILPLRVGTLHLCIVQARTLLSLYSFARGEYSAAWEHSGAAIRAVQNLRYHTEQGCLDDSEVANQSRCEFGFSVMQHAECKRRTFWSAFFLDRYSLGTVTMLKPQDVFVRLPCSEEMYENGLPSDAPYLNNGIVDPIKALLTAASPLSPMAWHALVASIWGDIVDFIFRAPHQAVASYRDIYESFYTDVCNRLQGWLTRLPDHLQYSTSNLDRSIHGGYAGAFISIHALHHLCYMKLNRCLRHALAKDFVTRNIRAAHNHGHQMLQLMSAVNFARRDVSVSAYGQARTFVFSTPFAGYATLAAIDIVSAGGTDSALASTLEEISGGISALQELAQFWSSAKYQARLCEKRYYQIQNILKNPGRARGGAWLGRNWGLEKPLESELSLEDDCVYGLGDVCTMYWEALGDLNDHSKVSSGGLRIG